MNDMKYAKLAVTTLASVLLLAGCGNNNEKDQTERTTASEEAQTSSLNAYVAILNQLINGVAGLEQIQNHYLSLNIPKATEKDSLSYPKLNYDYIRDKFAEADKAPKNNPALDSAAADLKQKIEALSKDYDDFHLYYESGEYKTDHLAKGKAADAAIREHFQQAVASFKTFQKELTLVYKKEKQAELEQIKASGDMYLYHNKAAMSAAENLVSVFGSEQDLNNPEKFKEADQFADDLQAHLKALDAEQKKIKEKNPNANTNTILLNLTSCLSYYRKFKESKDQYDFQFMVDGYNQAVQSTNSP